MPGFQRFGVAIVLLALGAQPALAQKPGGVLRMYHFDSPASLSLHEEVTFAALGPAMGLFNNLVMFDQHVPQAGFDSIVPDLASRMVVGLVQDRVALPAARRRQMARRQAVYRQ